MHWDDLSPGRGLNALICFFCKSEALVQISFKMQRQHSIIHKSRSKFKSNLHPGLYLDKKAPVKLMPFQNDQFNYKGTQFHSLQAVNKEIFKEKKEKKRVC